MSKEAKALFDEAATLVPTLQKTTDPKTHKKLVPNKPAPNVALAAAGLGLHREAYKNGAKAMAEMNKVSNDSITAAQLKNPKLVKEWKERFARYDELLLETSSSGMKRRPSLEMLAEGVSAAGAAVGAGMKKAGSFVGLVAAPAAAPVAAAEKASPTKGHAYPVEEAKKGSKEAPKAAEEAKGDAKAPIEKTWQEKLACLSCFARN